MNELENLRKEVAALRSWKTDAMTLLELYDGLAESVGGSLGMRKTEILAAELARLREANAALLAACKDLLKAEWMVTHDWGGNRDAVIGKVTTAIAIAEKK